MQTWHDNMTGSLEGPDAMIFQSRSGNQYLIDAATTSVHYWPWKTTLQQLNLLYEGAQESLPALVDQMGAPTGLGKYLILWRQRSGAFGGNTHPYCGSDSKTAASQPPPLSLYEPSMFANLMLVLTDACNLACKYCLYSGQYSGFHGRRNRSITWEIAKSAIDHFLEINNQKPFEAMHNRKINIAFFGGEPLLEYELIRRVIEYSRPLARSHYWIDYSLTTNLTDLSDELAEFLVRNQVGVEVSLDGPEEVHNLYRCDKNGQGSFRTVINNLGRLRRLSPKYFDDRVRAVVTIKAKDGERQPGLDLLDRLEHPIGTTPPDGAVFGPTGEDVGERQTVDEIAGHGVAAVGHRVGLEEAGTGDVPMPGLDGDLILQQGSWFGGAAALGVLGSERLEQAIQGGGTGRQELVFDRLRHGAMLLFVEGQP